MTGLVAGGVGRLALAEAKDRLTGLPKWVYYAVGITLLLFLVIRWDAGRIKAAEKRGSDSAYASIEKQARALETKASAISSKSRTLNDETNRHIDGRARTVLVRGPGKAVCSNSVPAAPSGREQAGGAGNAALPRVPYPEWQSLIGMPFTSTVEFARLCDANRSEVLTWRDWHKQQSEGTQP